VKTYYCEDTETGKQASLKTKDKTVVERLLATSGKERQSPE